MTDTTLEQGGDVRRAAFTLGETHGRWSRFVCCCSARSALVFTRVIAARVPEQRATLEKLITDRTGLAVRFDNVHFAWDLDGTSAVFDARRTHRSEGRPRARRGAGAARRIRHLGFPAAPAVLARPCHARRRRTSRSSAIRTTRRPRSPRRAAAQTHRRRGASRRTRPRSCAASPGLGRAHAHRPRRGRRRACASAAPRRFTRKARTPQLHAEPGGGEPRQPTASMPTAPCCCRRMSASRCSCRPSSRVWAPAAKVSGDLRLIARRVFLDKLPVLGLSGPRHARRHAAACATAASHSGRWQASARELELRW